MQWWLRRCLKSVFCFSEKNDGRSRSTLPSTWWRSTGPVVSSGRSTLSQVRSFCWFFNSYSDSIKMLGVMENDFVTMSCLTMVRTKLKPKQVLPLNTSTWTINCLERDPKPSVNFLQTAVQSTTEEVWVNSAIHHVVEVENTKGP